MVLRLSFTIGSDTELDAELEAAFTAMEHGLQAFEQPLPKPIAR